MASITMHVPKGAGRSRKAASQSAMEYLMTYGWAILIIAVVLGALYSLGVFNAVNFMPKVPGGGCHVFRPNGPGTSWNVNLVGNCNNALPQYVAQFNGQSSYVSAGKALITGNQMTLVGWALLTTGGSVSGAVVSQSSTFLDWFNGSSGSTRIRFYLTTNPGGTSASVDSNDYPLGVWHQIVGTYNGSTAKLYVDGVQEGTPSSITGNVADVNGAPVEVGGVGASTGFKFAGSIANVQIYNTSLTANQAQYLYNEGIGGVPISPQYLVGWWPLNGDTNDYGGNNNNGAATAITFNGTWTRGYNVP